MRKIGFTKCKNKTKEVLPKIYKVEEITCQRRMFCTMINQYLSRGAQLNLNNNHIYKNSLLHIFEDKILSFFQFYKFRPEGSQKVVKIYLEDSLLFNQYFKQSQNFRMRYMSKNIYFNSKFKMLFGYIHPVSDLIQLIFNGKEIEMMLDLNEIFTRTIYNRIKQEINKTVTLDSPYIHINQDGVTTRIHPKWKYVNPKNLKVRNNDIEDGFKHLNETEIDQCYLMYPKTNTFKENITVANNTLDTLEMIPYSLSFVNEKEKKCQK